jgi:hypothetical protein
MQLETTKRKVKEILLTHEHTREDDNSLIMQMLISIYGLNQRGLSASWFDLPSINTISRLRREIQTETPATRPPESVYLMRLKAEGDYKKRYAKNLQYI